MLRTHALHFCSLVVATLVVIGTTRCDSDNASPAVESPDAETCPADSIACGTRCVDLRKDPNACGSCGIACDSAEVCSRGTCQLSCHQGLNDCSGACVNLRTDLENCGACGAACAPGQVCSNGTPATSCQLGLELCGRTCADLLTDALRCGDCDTACAPGELCSNGFCSVTCQTELSLCDGLCANLQTSRFHCGTCNAACAPGEVCSNGVCAPSCQAGLSVCSSACADLRTDNANCGSCGTRCAPGTVCSQGGCETSCRDGLEDCRGLCIDTAQDARHCGACSAACASGEVCQAGHCVPSCQQGLLACSGSCVDPAVDERFCGALAPCDQEPGTVCGPGQRCEGGVCTLSCPPGTETCGDPLLCTNTQVDPAHCGQCNIACPQVASASAVCVHGSCDYVCDSGVSDCDGISANGCETLGVCSMKAVAVAVLDEYGLTDIDERFTESEIAAQSTLLGDVSFEEALRAALDSWLTDGSDIESPLSLVSTIGEDPFCPSGPLDEQLLCHMNRPTSRIGLSYLDGAVHDGIYPPEAGETIAEHWVLFLYLGTVSDHLYWAVVSRTKVGGQVSAYNYGFN